MFQLLNSVNRRAKSMGGRKERALLPEPLWCVNESKVEKRAPVLGFAGQRKAPEETGAFRPA